MAGGIYLGSSPGFMAKQALLFTTISTAMHFGCVADVAHSGDRLVQSVSSGSSSRIVSASSASSFSRGPCSPASRINDWARARSSIDWRRACERAASQGEESAEPLPNFVSPSLLVVDSLVGSKNGIRGVVATRDIAPGEVLVVSGGICCPLGPGSNEECAAKVISEAVAKGGDVGEAAEYISWFGAWDQDGAAPDPDRVLRMVDTCAFATVMSSRRPPISQGAVGEDRQHEYIGLFGYPSLFNHECAPNCWSSFWGKTMIVGSIASIRVGEEVTLMYRFDSSCHFAAEPNQERDRFERIHLEGPWGFVCTCRMCTLHRLRPSAFDRVMHQLGRAAAGDLPDLSAIGRVRESGRLLGLVEGEGGPHLQLGFILAALRTEDKVDAAKLWRSAAEAVPLNSPLAYAHLFPPAYVWSELVQAEEDSGVFSKAEIANTKRVRDEMLEVLGLGNLELGHRRLSHMFKS